MSLQVCHCGWSKVTTYHGLRTHQGKMGCTKRGVKVEKSEQQYMWGNVGFTNNQKDLSLDVYASIKTDTTDYIYSDLSLQVCHCGWSKVTTYHGLRTHQGMMGCTPKAARIPKKEQYMWTNQWEEVDERKHQPAKRMTVKKENTATSSSIKVCTSSAATAATIKVECKEYSHHQLYDFSYVSPSCNSAAAIKEEPKSPLAIPRQPFQKDTNSRTSHQLQDYSTSVQVNHSSRERPTAPPLAAVGRPKEQDRQDHTLSELNRSFREHPTPTYPVTVVREKGKKQQKPSQVKRLVRECRATTSPAAAVKPKKIYREDQTLSQDVQVSPSCNSAATIKEEPKSHLAIPRQTFKKDTNSRARHQLQDYSAGVQVDQSSNEQQPTASPLAAVDHPKEQDRQDHTLTKARQEGLKSELQQTIKERGENMSEIRPVERACKSVPDSASTNTQTNSAAAEATTKEDQKLLCKTTHPDFSTGMKVSELVTMFSATTTQETAGRQKRKCREEKQVSEVTHLAQKLSATTTQETIVPIKENDREEQKLSQNVRESAATQVNRASAEAIAEEDPKSSSETAQLSNYFTRVKVKDLARMFSANTTQDTAVRAIGKHQEEQKVKRLTQTLSATTDQERAVHPKEQEWEDRNLPQVRQDRITADVKPKTQMREQRVAQGRSSVKGSLDTEWLEINGVLSEVVRVVEDAKRKSADLSFSIRTFRATSSIMEQIRQKLEKLASIELKWISKFAVDVKLDPTTANRCLVAADGKKVSNGGEKQEAPDAPGRPGSVLGLNRLTCGKSYWEAVVSKKTGWDLGVARRDANHKGKRSLKPDNGYWVIAHYEDEKDAALTAPPVRLSLKEKPEKVGVFVHYEEGLVSFYDVTAQVHIYSFTDCSFTGEIYPYFSLHLEDGESADPLILSIVKHQ